MTLPLPAGSVLLIRHARATGQAPDASLTAEGEAGASALATALERVGLTRVVSSPWRRATDTAAPLCAALGLPLQTDERLTERVLIPRDLAFWRLLLKLSFVVPQLALPGGESGAVARARILAALEDARVPAGVTAVVTHGNLMALALGLDYAGWAGLQNPDVWVYTATGPGHRWEGRPQP